MSPRKLRASTLEKTKAADQRAADAGRPRRQPRVVKQRRVARKAPRSQGPDTAATAEGGAAPKPYRWTAARDRTLLIHLVGLGDPISRAELDKLAVLLGTTADVVATRVDFFRGQQTVKIRDASSVPAAAGPRSASPVVGGGSVERAPEWDAELRLEKGGVEAGMGELGSAGVAMVRHAIDLAATSPLQRESSPAGSDALAVEDAPVGIHSSSSATGGDVPVVQSIEVDVPYAVGPLSASSSPTPSSSDDDGDDDEANLASTSPAPLRRVHFSDAVQRRVYSVGSITASARAQQNKARRWFPVENADWEQEMLKSPSPPPSSFLGKRARFAEDDDDDWETSAPNKRSRSRAGTPVPGSTASHRYLRSETPASANPKDTRPSTRGPCKPSAVALAEAERVGDGMSGRRWLESNRRVSRNRSRLYDRFLSRRPATTSAMPPSSAASPHSETAAESPSAAGAAPAAQQDIETVMRDRLLAWFGVQVQRPTSPENSNPDEESLPGYTTSASASFAWTGGAQPAASSSSPSFGSGLASPSLSQSNSSLSSDELSDSESESESESDSEDEWDGDEEEEEY